MAPFQSGRGALVVAVGWIVVAAEGNLLFTCRSELQLAIRADHRPRPYPSFMGRPRARGAEPRKARTRRRAHGRPAAHRSTDSRWLSPMNSRVKINLELYSLFYLRLRVKSWW